MSSLGSNIAEPGRMGTAGIVETAEKLEAEHPTAKNPALNTSTDCYIFFAKQQP